MASVAPLVPMPSGAPLIRESRERWVAAALTATVAGLLLFAGPAPGDAPAHLYRTFLVRHGVVLWDNLWYAGHYPLASYSLLYYLPAAVVGNLPLVFGAAVASAQLFVMIAYREWGTHARWATRAFAVLAAAPLFTGLYSYTVGFAALLGGLHALQRGRIALFSLLAALTLGLSPLAFVFLIAILAAVALARAGSRTHRIRVAGALSLLVLFEVVVLVVFPTSGTYPFDYRDLICVLGVCALGVVVSARAAQSRVILWLFVVWGAGSVVAFLVPSAIGDNWTRLRGFVFPLMLLAAVHARFRPRLLVGSAIAASVAYNLIPYVMLIPYRADGQPATATFWQPAIRFLRSHGPPLYRVEVVPTAAHWESYWIPRAGFALARGWYRQLDIATNPVLYRRHLTRGAYNRWLRAMSVRYVLLPSTKLDPDGGPAERRMVVGDRSLRLVFADATWRIYRVRARDPLLSGSAPSALLALGHTRISGWVASAGLYRLDVRYTPYWQISPPTGCVERSTNGMTLVRLRTAGRFTLRAPSSFDGILDVLGHSGAVCTS